MFGRGILCHRITVRSLRQNHEQKREIINQQTTRIHFTLPWTVSKHTHTAHTRTFCAEENRMRPDRFGRKWKSSTGSIKCSIHHRVLNVFILHSTEPTQIAVVIKMMSIHIEHISRTANYHYLVGWGAHFTFRYISTCNVFPERSHTHTHTHMTNKNMPKKGWK